MLFKFSATVLSMMMLLPFGEVLAAPPKQVREVSRPLPVEKAEEGLTAPIVFQLLLGEIALQRGDLGLSVQAYQDLAVRTRDPGVIRRAVELSGAAKQYDVALELTQLWIEVEPDSKDARQLAAGLLVIAGRLEDLYGLVSEALASEPDKLGDNFLNLPRLLARYPDKAGVLAFVEKVAEPYPTQAEAYYAVAIAAADAGQIEQAKSEARRAQAIKPEWDAPVLFESRLILKEEGEAGIPEAVRLVSAYLEKQPDSLEARLHLARMLIGAKDYAGARKQFDAILKDRPNDPEVVYPVAMLALQEKDLETARTQFSHLLELPFPDQWAARFFLGQVEEEAGNTATALIHYEQVEGGSQYLSARGRIAYLLADSGKIDEAVNLIQSSKVGSIDDKVQLIHLEAEILRKAKRYEDAYKVLSAALKANPNDPSLLYDGALAAEKVGHMKEMEAHLKHLITLQPDHAHAYNALGYSLVDRNIRLKEAHALIAKAVELAPEDPFIMDSMGWVLYRQGNLPEAALTLEKAYRIKPDPEIAAHLGEVLWKLGRQDEALALWAKAQKEFPDNEALAAVIKQFKP